ncbi:MAG: TonB-dependent receptor [Deltaproteobacteria bacterium]|nr:TonB-dependent receptor [Deltaproteobacteria bacterium]
MKTLNYITGIFLIAGFISTQANASEKHNGQTVYTLGEIVVSAEGQGVETIGTVRELTSDQIEASGAETLDEALKLLPGINVVTGGQGVPRLNLRGMRPRHVTLLIDGIPFNSAGDGQFDPSLITTVNIAKIKISYGNDSVLYGTGGLGGVINVITKKGTEKTEINIDGKYRQKDNILAKANISGGTDKVNYFVSASDYSSDGYRLSDDFIKTDYEDGGTRNNSDKELRSLFGNVTLTPNDKTQAGLIINYITGEYGIPAITLDRDDPFGKNPKYERVDDHEAISMSLSGCYNINGHLSFRGWAFMNDLEEIKNGYDNDTYTTQRSRNSYRANETTEIRGATLQTQYLFDNSGKVSLTLGAKKERFKSLGWIMESASSGGGGGGGGGSSTAVQSPFDETHEITTQTVAVEYEIQPLESLGFVAGYGYSWLRKENNPDDDTDNFMVGFNYDFTKNSRIRGSIADNIRFPSVTQLYGVDEGNPNLDFEKSINYELGFEQSMNNIDTIFSITGFRRDVENYISKDDDGVNQNHEEYQFQGVEITAGNNSIEDLELRLAYTYMDSKDKSRDTLVNQIQYNPEHTLAFECVYNFAFDVSAYTSIERIEKQYYYNSDYTLKGRLPDYTVINLRVEKRLFSGSMKIYVGADNLFDKNYFESYALPREGRSLYGGFTYSFR